MAEQSLQFKQIDSPNCDMRPNHVVIDTIVMHYTGMRTGEEALARLCDPLAKVSAHYMVETDGTLYRLVAEQKQAWHAGISCWNGKAAVNENSIGIEIVNPGHEFGYRAFPAVQMDAVRALCQDILTRYSIKPQNIVGHSDIAPSRKSDPGELFDWAFLAAHGIGHWVDMPKIKYANKLVASPGDESVTVATFQRMLLDYGYHIRVDGYYGFKTEAIIRAFKRHFIQNEVNALWDNRAQAVLAALLASVPKGS